MREVEILVQVLDDKEKALKKLGKFEFKGEKKIIDTYFGMPNDMRYLEFKVSLRIRQVEGKCFIAFKKDNFENSKWLYSDEYETEVDNYESAREILANLGFNELVKLENVKHKYQIDNYEIVLEEVDGLGLFLEVERLNLDDKEDVQKVRSEIQTFIDGLKIAVSKELNVGKLELMMKKNIGK